MSSSRPSSILNGIGRVFRATTANRRVWLPGALLIVLLAGWEVVGQGRAAVLTSSPSEVLAAYVDIEFVGGRLIPSLRATLAGLALGYALGASIGTLTGYLMGANRYVAIALEPYVNGLYATPRIALIPLLILWAGIGFELRVVVVTLSCTFPLIVNTYRGAIEVPRAHRDVAAIANAGPWQRWRSVTFPSSLPHLRAGLRIGALRALGAAIVAEMVAALSGTGKLLLDLGRFFQTGRLFATILAIGLLGIALSAAIEAFVGVLPGSKGRGEEF